MAKQTIDLGTTANDGTGTPHRDYLGMINSNFDELYGKTDSVEVAGQRFVIDAGGAALVEAGLSEIVVTGGRPSTYPNVIGSSSATIQGVDFSPGSTWGADSGYVAGSADVASIHGGYDQINNQSGATMLHSDHSHIQYNSLGHSCIIGGSYCLVSAGRSAAVGSRDTAIEGNIAFGSTLGCDGTTVNSDHGAAVGAKDTTVSGGYSLANGRAVTISSGHDYSRISGRDASSPGAYSDTFGGVKLIQANDVRRFSTLHSLRASDATLTNMSNMLTLPAGKVFTAILEVNLIAIRDGSANGNNDSNNAAAAYTGRCMYTWDGTDGIFADAVYADGPSAAPTFNLTEVHNDLGIATAPHLATNGGLLRPKVTGLAGTTINWVAEIRAISTLVS